MMSDENIEIESPLEQDSPEAFPSPKKPSELSSNVHTFELEKDYSLPPWSSKPSKNYFLEIIKGGVVIGTKAINEKPFYLVGKLPDLCDIVLEHPSVSRKHAVFQHKNDGSLYLFDLGSSHGVKVNKTTLTHKTYHKVNIGDVIKFGFSSRLFIVGVDGETNPEQNNEQIMIAQFRNQENEKSQAVSTKASIKEKYLDLLRQKGQYKPLLPKKIVNNPADGISWGMVDEDEIRAHEDQDDFKMDPDVLRELEGLSSKDYDNINNYEKKLRQYQNLEREIEIINKKEREDYGLTENDKNKRSALEAKVNDAYSKLQMLEDNLRYALFEETKTTKDRIAKRREADSFEDDEFYDRTIKKLKTEDESRQAAEQKVAEGETFESLKVKLENLISRRQELNEKILELALNPELEKKEEAKTEEMDELDMFMKENDSKVKAESKSQLLHELKDANSEIEEITKLLKFVKPTYKIDMNTIEKKAEEKKTQPQPQKGPVKQAEAKPQQKPALSDRIKEMKEKAANEGFQGKNLEDYQLPAATHKKEAPAKKVYGVMAKPPPRNMKESDYEHSEGVDTEWAPPMDAGESI